MNYADAEADADAEAISTPFVSNQHLHFFGPDDLAAVEAKIAFIPSLSL